MATLAVQIGQAQANDIEVVLVVGRGKDQEKLQGFVKSVSRDQKWNAAARSNLTIVLREHPDRPVRLEHLAEIRRPKPTT